MGEREDQRGDRRRGGDGQHPGPDDPPGEAPSYGAVALPCGETGSISFTFSTNQTAITCGDKVFSNFTGTASGTVTIKETTATSYELTLTAPVGGVSTGFTFGYTVTVNPALCATCFINQIQQNMQTQQASGGSQIPNASTGVNTINNGGAFVCATCSPASNTTNAINANNQNSLASGLTNTSYTVGFSYNPNGTAGQPAGLFLNVDDVISQSAVPEPVSLSLTGLGLLGLGFFGRRRLKS